MAWVRIHDGALSHPKIVGMFDPRNPFCLWIWGLSYCQQHLTDGLIQREAITFKTAQAIAALLARGLWQSHPTGYVVHDYLHFNDSKETVTKKRTEAKERMKNARDRSSRERSLENNARSSTWLGLSTESKEKECEEKHARSPAETVLDAFRTHWKRLYGFECSLLLKPLEFMQLEQQIDKVQPAQLLAALGAYFSSQDPYVLKARHPFPLFLRDPLKYLATEAVVKTLARGCQHEPPCVDNAAHTKRDLADRRRIS